MKSVMFEDNYLIMAVYLLVVQPWRQFARCNVTIFLGAGYRTLLACGILLGLTNDPQFWSGVVFMHFFWVVKAYHVADNHAYLEGYWCISILLSFVVPEADRGHFLVRSSTALIGICFMVAAAVKLLRPRFRDGNFFVYEMIYDPRFAPLTGFLGVKCLLGPELLQARDRVASGCSRLEKIQVHTRVVALGRLLTFWTIAVEFAIASIFLAPSLVSSSVRVFALLLFIATTYILIPVERFGIILIVLLCAGTDDLGLRMLLVLIAFSLPVACSFAAASHQRYRSMNAFRQTNAKCSSRPTGLVP